MPFATVFCIFINLGLRETINSAAGAMQKSQNGGDIPDKDLFVRRIGATRAFDGAVNIGGDDNPWTTAEFISWLESCGAFNHPYWMCRGSWSYAHNKIITDTGCGNICLAGAVIEVMGVRGAINQYAYWLIAQYDYTGNANVTLYSAPEYSETKPANATNGQTYTLYNSINKPAADEMGALSVNGGRINGALGIGTDNALGGNSIVLGDNDTGLKQNGDGILDIFANNQHTVRVAPGEMIVLGAIRAGNGKKLSLTSTNNSALNAGFNLWGDGGNRPTVIELGDDQGWHFYSQRNPDGSVLSLWLMDRLFRLTVNCNLGDARYLSVTVIYNGSKWGVRLNDWINNTIIKRFAPGYGQAK